MYHKINIHQLSPAQISKLMNGHKVRVKHGQHHYLHVSEEQHKKIMAAHKKGKAHTLQFFPNQAEENLHLRGGSFKSVMKSVGKFVKPIAKKVAPMVIDYGTQALKSYVEGSGAKAVRSRRGRALSGGSFKSVMKSVGKFVKPIAKKVAPIVIDYGTQAAKSYLSGAGARGARGRRGRALMPAGYGVEDDMSEDEEGMGFNHIHSPAQSLYHAHQVIKGKSILGDMKKGFKKYAPVVAKNAIKYAPLALSLM